MWQKIFTNGARVTALEMFVWLKIAAAAAADQVERVHKCILLQKYQMVQISHQSKSTNETRGSQTLDILTEFNFAGFYFSYLLYSRTTLLCSISFLFINIFFCVKKNCIHFLQIVATQFYIGSKTEFTWACNNSTNLIRSMELEGILHQKKFYRKKSHIWDSNGLWLLWYCSFWLEGPKNHLNLKMLNILVSNFVTRGFEARRKSDLEGRH